MYFKVEINGRQTFKLCIFGDHLALVPRKLVSCRRFAVQSVLHTGGTPSAVCSARRGARCPKGTVAISRAQALQQGTGCHRLAQPPLLWPMPGEG